jgi:hypothetical protein
LALFCPVRRLDEALAEKGQSRANGTKRSRLKTGAGSFLSAHDPRMVLGIGQAKGIDFLEIKRPLPSGET